ncbi:MAG: NAD(P)H-binding protein [Pseudomonadota bacterium]
MHQSSKRILLAGATGYIGRAVAAALLRAGHDVVALTRQSPTTDIDGYRWISADITAPGAMAAATSDLQFDAVISCIASRTGAPRDAWAVEHDANLQLLQAAVDSGATQFVLLSAICVQRPRLAFQHAKLAFETRLMASGIDYSIVRPTAFFKSLSGQIERIRNGKPFLLFGDGTLTACKPISADDLADYLIDCLHVPERRNQILPIGGPGPAITPREQGQLLFDLAGIEPTFKSVSPKLLSGIAAVLTPLAKLLPPVATKAEFARIGHYYATESMLLWDEQQQRYDADATPSTGNTTLREHYEAVLRDGIAGHEAGAHKLF